MDRPGRVAFTALSERCSESLAKEWAEEAGMRLVAFHTRDAKGFPICARCAPPAPVSHPAPSSAADSLEACQGHEAQMIAPRSDAPAHVAFDCLSPRSSPPQTTRTS